MTTPTTYAGKAAMDKVAAKAAAAEAAEERRRKAALADVEIREARDRAAEKRRRAAEAARTKAAEEKSKRKAARAVRRRAALARAGAVATSPLPWVLAVIVASVAVAWPGQVAAVRKLGMDEDLALLVPLFTELPTWAMAWMRRQAIENRRPAAIYAWATWGFAAVAAGLNGWAALPSVRLAAVMALSSLVGVIVWEIYMVSQSARVAGRSAAEVRLRIARRVRHPRVAWRASWLAAATGQPADSAWEAAWRLRYGAQPGVTERLLRRHAERAQKVAAAEEALRAVVAAQAPAYWSVDAHGLTVTGPKPPEKSPQASASAPKKPQLAPVKPPAAKARETATEGAPRKQSRAARTAAAETARAATPEAAEAEKTAAREWVRVEVAAGRAPGWRDLAAHLSETAGITRGETWCRARIRETQPAGAAA